LKNVSLRIPKRKITIFTGVSGSGKSSIVFDTIATESQRLLNENFSMFVRNFLPKYSQPDADAIENLSMSIVVDQKRMGGVSPSTSELRTLFDDRFTAPDDSRYEQARTVFYGGIDRRPAAIVRLADAGDVSRLASLARYPF
jgi:energy-coupling factor transporter ATP-binding protein EcfA2